MDVGWGEKMKKIKDEIAMFWIPVTERLPVCDEKWGMSEVVWCCDAWGRMGFGIYENGSHLRYNGWFTGGKVGEDSVKITHWMPLPEPPGK